MRPIILMIAALAVFPAERGPARTEPQLSSDEADAVLAIHNREREGVGAPPLRWDPALADAAAGYARHLASGAPFVHSPRAGREGQRENLSRGGPGAAPEAMVGLWTREKRDFVPGQFPDVSRTGRWGDVAHYTQMIWKGTTHVGCATAGGASGEYMVCRYSPPGNADGRFVP